MQNILYKYNMLQDKHKNPLIKVSLLSYKKTSKENISVGMIII